MPLNKNLKKVLVIGSGPIVIGQAAEFDYSGTQSLKAIKEEGLEVALINSNPATIMTDKIMADSVYLEPLTEESLLQIINKENPDGLLAGFGGQTALNLAVSLHNKGMIPPTLKLLGTPVKSIIQAEDRDEFRSLMQEIGEPVPDSSIINNVDEAISFSEEIGFPLIIRPAYTLGGTGGGIANNKEELIRIIKNGLLCSPINQCLLEKSIAGFKELEYEVIRDHKDNCIIICNMENVDPVGVHTGDSIVVAPAQTLTDQDHQKLRTASLKIIRALKIEGGCNIQFAYSPFNDDYYVIEVNPRVSRSSALASKATGYPIANIATKLALGYSLDELKNPITQKTSALFEPTIDYIVTKIPRWPFDKFQSADRSLGPQMKATGEVMAIGRNFEESLLKAVRSLEIGETHLELKYLKDLPINLLKEKLKQTDDERIFVVAEALRRKFSTKEIHKLTTIDFFFLEKIKNIVDLENSLQEQASLENISPEKLRRYKSFGFTDKVLASILKSTEDEVKKLRDDHNIKPVFKMVDTCAAEFEAQTPYYYSTYETEDEVTMGNKPSIVVLGSGPIRIGQGVEFDYATVHSIMAIKEMGYDAVIINNNPETVSTDFNISDRLYFDPLYIEDVLSIIEKEKPVGVIVQFGGQTALNLSQKIHEMGIPILGTTLENIDRAEDREKFEELLQKLDIIRPLGQTVNTAEEAMNLAHKLGFPLVVRPSYVLGGRAMQLVFNAQELENYISEAVKINPEHPVLIDRYIIGREIEVDAISDGKNIVIPGIMEHLERAGVHSGDSIAVYPPQTLSQDIKNEIIKITEKIALGLEAKGLVNIQYVVSKGQVYVIEVNPRASRTVPFLSKVTNIQMAQVATKCILGKSLKDQGFDTIYPEENDFVSVKVPVFSFAKLPRVDVVLGPEMKSTGEVMGMDKSFPKALYKGLEASGISIRPYGTILASIADKDKEEALPLLKRYAKLGHKFLATSGTSKLLQENDIPVKTVKKVSEGEPNLLEDIRGGNVDLIINTLTRNRQVASDGFIWRRIAVENSIVCLTSLDTTQALLESLESKALMVRQL